MKNSYIDRCVNKWLGHAFPGLVLGVRLRGHVILKKTWGHRELRPRRVSLCPDAVFDLASMTKALSTGIITLMLVDAGKLRYETTVGSVVTDAHPRTRDITVHHLLTHTSGLPAIPMLQRFFPDADNLDPVRAERELLAIEPEAEPGDRVVYSCTGFQVLGIVLQRLTGRTIAELFQEMIARPLALESACFQPRLRAQTTGDRSFLDRIAATEYCPWRARWVHADVHDESAYCLGGSAGNAGLFASFDDVLKLTATWALCGPDRLHLLKPDTVAVATRSHTDGMAQRRGLSVQMNSEEAAGGDALDSESFGHTGFTGTHFWIDPTRELTVVGLCSRLQYGRDATLEITKQFRRELHAAIVREFDLV